MPTAEAIHYVRTLLSGDVDEAVRYSDEELDPETRAECDELLETTFIVAAHRHFRAGGGEDTLRDVIEFVARARIDFDDGPDVNPRWAEAVVLDALDPTFVLPDEIDTETLTSLTLRLLFKLVHDESLTDEGIDELLRRAAAAHDSR